MTKDATHAESAALGAFLPGAEAKAAFEKKDFTILDRPANGS